MDLLHTVAVMELVHSYVIVDNFATGAKLTAEISAFTILEGFLMLVTTFVVQMFFASRVYMREDHILPPRSLLTPYILVRRTHWAVPLFIALTSVGSFGKFLTFHRPPK
ncbi:hypothetical protein VKT23_003662 [Stygiomarasmius scandens]|uniref:Uncharacterized protein n=1 Tax=Marasmiellus scandens TaxID=2682957 RepID=A0ABR1JXX6_9AGAR